MGFWGAFPKEDWSQQLGLRFVYASPVLKKHILGCPPTQPRVPSIVSKNWVTFFPLATSFTKLGYTPWILTVRPWKLTVSPKFVGSRRDRRLQTSIIFRGGELFNFGSGKKGNHGEIGNQFSGKKLTKKKRWILQHINIKCSLYISHIIFQPSVWKRLLVV